MVFGEIVEPSTRAYLDDDDDCLVYKDIEWIKEIEMQPIVNTVLVSETEFANKILIACLLKGQTPEFSTKNGEIAVYNLNNNYIILCSTKPNISVGEQTSKIMPWVQNARNIYGLTTAPSATFQSRQSEEHPICFIRMLSTCYLGLFPTLETPNLITGVGANVLSYAIHTKRNCSLFAAYHDFAPVDSENSKPIVELLQKINLEPNRLCLLEEKLPSNNLYM